MSLQGHVVKSDLLCKLSIAQGAFKEMDKDTFYANARTFDRGSNGLTERPLTNDEYRLSWGMYLYLNRACKIAKKRGEATVQTALFGKFRYTEKTVGRGRKRSTEHCLSFLDGENVLGYTEMRTALVAAIWGITGQPTYLIVDFDGTKAIWNFIGGAAMSDQIR